MRRICIFVVFAVGLLTFLTGCPSFSTLHTATPMEEGKTQVTLGSGLVQGLPTGEIALRHGLGSNVDAGGKLYPIGFAMDVNYAFVNESTFAASVNPYFSGTHFSGGGASLTYGFGLLNLLADVAKTETASLTVGLKPGVFYTTASMQDVEGVQGFRDSGAYPVIGGMAGVTLRLTDTFSVMPNVDILVPAEDPSGHVFWNAGFAMNF